MICWRYVLPRCAILIGACALLQHATPPILRWAIVESATTTGVTVEVGDVDFSLSNLRIALRDVAVADPNQPERSLLEAKRVLLDIDGASLLRKKMVVRSGRISGLKLNQAGETHESCAVMKGESDSTKSPLHHSAEKPATIGANGTVSWASGKSENLFEDLSRQLESPNLAKTFAARWPAKVDVLQTQLREFQARVGALRQQTYAMQSNPLRKADALQDVLGQVGELADASNRLRAEANDLLPEMQREWNAIDDAKTRDLEKLSQLKLAPVDPAALNDYLLNRELSGHVGFALQWLRQIRRLTVCERSASPSGRGWDVLFAGQTRRPDYLIRSVAIDGESEMDGRPVTVVGTAIGVTTRPKEYGRPTIIKIAMSGAAKVSVRASLDRTGEIPCDRLSVHCPSIAIPARTFGDSEFVALVAAPSTAEVLANVTVSGERLEGKLRWTSRDLSLRPNMGETFAHNDLAGRLKQSLAEHDSFSAVAQVSGTINAPSLRIVSDLGQIVAAGVHDAFELEFERKRQQIAAQLRQEVEASLAAAVSRFENQHQELLATFGEQRDALRQLAEHIPGSAEPAAEMAGRLPRAGAPR